MRRTERGSAGVRCRAYSLSEGSGRWPEPDERRTWGVICQRMSTGGRRRDRKSLERRAHFRRKPCARSHRVGLVNKAPIAAVLAANARRIGSPTCFHFGMARKNRCRPVVSLRLRAQSSGSSPMGRAASPCSCWRSSPRGAGFPLELPAIVAWLWPRDYRREPRGGSQSANQFRCKNQVQRSRAGHHCRQT